MIRAAFATFAILLFANNIIAGLVAAHMDALP